MQIVNKCIVSGKYGDITVDRINYLYNEIYINLIKELALRSSILFINPVDIKLESYIIEHVEKWANNRPFNEPEHDPYLKETMGNPIMLAKDILKNGTFAPLFIMNSKTNWYVQEGGHRVYSIKEYDKNVARWSRDLLAIYDITKIQTDQRRLKPITTTALTVSSKDGSTVEKEFRNITELIIEIMEIFPFRIRNYILEANRKYNNCIKPNKYINSKEEFQKWFQRRV